MLSVFLKRVVIGMVLVLLYTIIVTLIILITKESRLTLDEIIAKNKRPKTYWNGIELGIDDENLIFIDVVDTSHDLIEVDD